MYLNEWVKHSSLKPHAFIHQGALERISEIWVTKINVIWVYLWWADSDVAPMDPQLLLFTLLCNHLPFTLGWMQWLAGNEESTAQGWGDTPWPGYKRSWLPPWPLHVMALVQRATWPGSEAALVQEPAWNWGPQTHSPRGTESCQPPPVQLGTWPCCRWTWQWLWSLTAAWWEAPEQRPQLRPARLPDSRADDKIIKYCFKPLTGEWFT